MTPWTLLAAALAFAAVIVVGMASRRRTAAATSPESGIWSDADQDGDGGSVADRLRMAGMGDEGSIRSFRLAHAGTIVALAGALGWLGHAIGGDLGTAAFAASAGALLGIRLPLWWLDGRVEARRIDMRSEFPVMLDLLQISMQGGLGLHAAWSATAGGLEGSGDALAQEMRRVDLAVGLGKTWGAALSEAAASTGVDEFRSLGSLLGQTQRFGTEVADMIRVLCDSLRHEELQSLEEQAHRMSVRMLLPLAGLLLPATLILVIAPLLLLLLEALQEASSN